MDRSHHFFDKRENFRDSHAFLHTGVPSENGSTLSDKKLAPLFYSLMNSKRLKNKTKQQQEKQQ